jgi:hypothetical protein
MASINDESVRLVLDLVKSGGSDATIAALEKLKTATKQADEAYEVLMGDMGTYAVVEKEVEQAIGRQTSAFTKLELGIGNAAAQTRGLTGSVNALKGSDGRGGQGVLAASYAVQDFTSQLGNQGLAGGLRAVQNNIPQILMGFGVGAGLTGILAGLAVAAGLVVDNWGRIKNAFTSDDVKKKTEEMEKFAESIKKSADAGEKAAESLKKMLSPDKQKPVEAIKRAAEAFGGDAVLRELTRGLVVSGRAGMRGGEAPRRAGELVAGVQAGDERAQKLMADILAKSGRGDIANMLMGGKTPAEEAKERADRTKKADEDNAAAEKKRQDAKKKNDEYVDDLNRRGQENQRLGEQGRSDQADKIREEGIKLGRDAGDALKRQQQQEQTQSLKLPRMKPLPENGSDEELLQGMIQNEMQAAINQPLLATQLQQVKQIQRKLRQVPNTLAGQQ